MMAKSRSSTMRPSGKLSSIFLMRRGCRNTPFLRIWQDRRPLYWLGRWLINPLFHDTAPHPTPNLSSPYLIHPDLVHNLSFIHPSQYYGTKLFAAQLKYLLPSYDWGVLGFSLHFLLNKSTTSFLWSFTVRFFWVLAIYFSSLESPSMRHFPSSLLS